jgi:predicted anti-sigma-YlaC factor YlaD
MRCREIRKMLALRALGALAPDVRGKIETHLKSCAQCKDFSDDVSQLRRELKNVSIPPLSSDLDLRTRKACRRLISERVHKPASARTPKWIMLAPVVLILLSCAFFLALQDSMDIFKPRSFGYAVLYTVLLENLIMIVFSPLIIRIYKQKKRRQDSTYFNNMQQLAGG